MGGGECKYLDDIVGYPVAEVGHRRVVGWRARARAKKTRFDAALGDGLQKLGVLHEASLTRCQSVSQWMKPAEDM